MSNVCAGCDDMPEYNYLRIKEVIKKVGLSRSTIYLLIKQGTFPAPVKIGVRAVAWADYKVKRWQDDRRDGPDCP